MVECTLKGFFVCNRCRLECDGSDDCMNDLEELHPRKQEIGCLGGYCDDPCDLKQDHSELTVQHLIPLVKYLGNRLNTFLIKDE